MSHGTLLRAILGHLLDNQSSLSVAAEYGDEDTNSSFGNQPQISRS